MHRHTPIAFGLLLAGALPATAMAGESIDESRPTSSAPVISIDMMNGDISIVGWDRDEFRVTGELSDRAEGYALDADNGGIRFEENLDRRDWDWRSWRNEDWADLEFRVPYDSVLRFEGTNTDIEVSTLRGNTDIEVVNGDVDAWELAGVISIETTNGSVDTRDMNGRISLETVNGSIRDRESRGERLTIETVNGSIDSTSASERVWVENVNGDIDLDLARIDDLEIETVNGHVHIRTALADRAHIGITSVGGRIELDLPSSSSASFNISTSVGGSIHNRLSDHEPQRKSRYTRASELDFVLGDGDGDVNISTVHGDITLDTND